MKPTFTWGQSEPLRLTNTASRNSIQLLDVALPRPAVCQVVFVVQVLSGAGVIWATTLNLFPGVGRTTLRRSFTFVNQPQIGTPLEVDLGPFAIEKLQADVTVQGNPAPELMLSIGLELAPFTNVPMESPALQFGMAMPGEADDLDESLREQWPQGYEPMEEAVDPAWADPYGGRLRR